jgi:protein phosphatase
LTRWRYAAATDIGLVRETNQDAIFIDDSLAVVADGMGGHAAGEVASAMTIENVHEGFLTDQTVEGLLHAIESANAAVLREARDNPNRFGMGTTIVAVGLTRDKLGVVSPTLFHVGDSRVYQLRDGALRQLTEDHSVAEEWVRMGRLTPEEALNHPRRHQLTRGVGVEDTIDIDVMSINAQAGDRLLLCSDGLSNELSPEGIARLASAPVPLDQAVNNLVEAAKQSGGHDNISAVLVEFDEAEVSSKQIKRTLGTAPPPVAQISRPGSHRAKRKGGWFSWRVGVGSLLGIGIVIGFFVVLHWYAYSTYYLAPDHGVIGVYQGQPSGVLWFKPVLVAPTNYSYAQLRPADQISLNATISEPSLDAALSYAASIHSDGKRVRHPRSRRRPLVQRRLRLQRRPPRPRRGSSCHDV